jgi:hypothetical protein
MTRQMAMTDQRLRGKAALSALGSSPSKQLSSNSATREGRGSGFSNPTARPRPPVALTLGFVGVGYMGSRIIKTAGIAGFPRVGIRSESQQS